MDKLQTHTNATFQPIDLKDGGYSSGASSQLSSKESLFSHVETESPDTVVMSLMLTEVTTLKSNLQA